MSFAVVRFLEETDSFMEIPSSWIFDDGRYCYWPNTKNCAPLIARSAPPDQANWKKEKINVEGYYDTLDKARKVANDPNYTSNDEEVKRCPKPKRWINVGSSVGSSTDEDGDGNYDRPPQLPKNTLKRSTKPMETKENIGKIKWPTVPAVVHNIQPRKPNDSQPIFLNTSITSDVTGCYEIQNGYLEDISNRCDEEGLSTITEDQLVVSDEDPNEDRYSQEPDKDYEELEETLVMENRTELENMSHLLKENNYYLKLIYKKLCKLELVGKQKASKMSTEVFSKTFPLLDIQQLVTLEADLNATKDPALMHYIEKIGGKSTKDNIHRCLRSVYTNQLAKSCSWLGLRGNFKIKDTIIMNVIREVMLKEHTALTDAEFGSIVSEWFRLASSRIKGKQHTITSD